MKKPETNTLEDTTDSIFPFDVSICAIQSINYVFDPEAVQVWSNEVVTHGDVIRSIKYEKNPLEYLDPELNYVPDLQLFIKIVGLQRQLIKDFEHAKNLDGLDKPVDIQLQRAALIIYSAKCWEASAFQTHAMFNTLYRESLDKHLKYIHANYIIPYYQEALGSLTIMPESLLLNMTNEQKKAWGTMMLYAKNKYFTILELYEKDKVMPNKRLYKNEVEDLLYNNGLGYLIPDYKPEIPDNRSFLETAQSLLWSSWQKMYGAVCGVEQPRYEQIATHQEQDIETRQVPETKSMSRDEVVTDEADAPGLKKRHINSPNKNL